MDTWSSGKNKANSNPIQSQNKPNTKPISDGIHPSSVDRPFASGLTAQLIWFNVDSFLIIAEWFDMLDFVFIDIRQ